MVLYVSTTNVCSHQIRAKLTKNTLSQYRFLTNFLVRNHFQFFLRTTPRAFPFPVKFAYCTTYIIKAWDFLVLDTEERSAYKVTKPRLPSGDFDQVRHVFVLAAILLRLSKSNCYDIFLWWMAALSACYTLYP